MTRSRDRHLSAELIQLFLDGEASLHEAGFVEDHTASCVRCRSELEAWRGLFSRLGGVTDMSPQPDFQDRVIGRLPVVQPARLPLVARAKAWLGVATPAPPQGHMTPDGIQDLLERRLPASRMSHAERHLHGCRACRRALEVWRGLLSGLDELPTFTPSPVFAEQVMAHVRVKLALETARPSLFERMQLLARSVSPDTRKRLAAIAGAAVTPAVTLGLLAYTIFSHPLVTPATLFQFLWTKGSDFASGLGRGLGDAITGHTAFFRATSALEFVTGSPSTTALAVAVLLGLLASASWVLYANVITHRPMETSYAR